MAQIIPIRPTPEREVVNLYEAEFLQLDEQVDRSRLFHVIDGDCFFIILGGLSALIVGLVMLAVQP